MRVSPPLPGRHSELRKQRPFALVSPPSSCTSRSSWSTTGPRRYKDQARRRGQASTAPPFLPLSLFVRTSRSPTLASHRTSPRCSHVSPLSSRLFSLPPLSARLSSRARTMAQLASAAPAQCSAATRPMTYVKCLTIVHGMVLDVLTRVCSQTKHHSSDLLASLLNLDIGDITGLLAVQCSPLNIIGAGGVQCDATPVCCSNQANVCILSCSQTKEYAISTGSHRAVSSALDVLPSSSEKDATRPGRRKILARRF